MEEVLWGVGLMGRIIFCEVVAIYGGSFVSRPIVLYLGHFETGRILCRPCNGRQCGRATPLGEFNMRDCFASRLATSMVRSAAASATRMRVATAVASGGSFESLPSRH